MMNEEKIKQIIDDYETKMQKAENSFKLTPFEKVLMRECLIYGFELGRMK